MKFRTRRFRIYVVTIVNKLSLNHELNTSRTAVFEEQTTVFLSRAYDRQNSAFRCIFFFSISQGNIVLTMWNQTAVYSLKLFLYAKSIRQEEEYDSPESFYLLRLLNDLKCCDFCCSAVLWNSVAPVLEVRRREVFFKTYKLNSLGAIFNHTSGCIHMTV